MKTSGGSTRIFILVLTLIFVPGAGRLSAETATEKSALPDVKQEISEAFQSVKNFSLKQKNEAVKKSKDLLDDLDTRLETMEGRLDKKWDRMDQKARQQAKDTLKSLRKQRAQVAEHYYELKYSSGQAWEEIKRGFVDSYRAISDSIAKAAKEF
jgi:hypothetical protein